MDRVEVMRQINKEQKRYYEEGNATLTSSQNTVATNIYRWLRSRALNSLDSVEIDRTVHALHRQWAPENLETKRVLDLGAGTGTELSTELARDSGEYVAIDLSASSLEILRSRLEEEGADNFFLVQADFLEDNFHGETFDVVYAHSVLHHFKFLDPFLETLRNRMVDGGVVLSRDPTQLWRPYSIFRQLYRPFQADAAWEHPFTRDSFDTISRYFNIDQVQGVLGQSKWAIPVSFFSKQWARRMAEWGHEQDLRTATSMEKIGTCLQVAMRLVKT